jgi:hypothetical protein
VCFDLSVVIVAAAAVSTYSFNSKFISSFIAWALCLGVLYIYVSFKYILISLTSFIYIYIYIYSSSSLEVGVYKNSINNVAYWNNFILGSSRNFIVNNKELLSPF